jgi:hypothetical protein
MCAPRTPLHLLLLAKARPHGVVDRRSHKARGDPLPAAVSPRIVGNEALGILDTPMEFPQRFQPFPRRAIAPAGGPVSGSIPTDRTTRGCPLNIPVLQEPFQALQLPHDGIALRGVCCTITGLVRPVLRPPLEQGHAHRAGYEGRSPLPPSDTPVRTGPNTISVLEYGKAHAKGGHLARPTRRRAGNHQTLTADPSEHAEGRVGSLGNAWLSW